MKPLELAAFRFDVTPPIGHSLCGGWIKPVVGVDDPLEAVGFVLKGAGEPIVLCTVDWTVIGNEANVAWRIALASAAGTTPDRVSVHCVHQHNAPMACLETERIVALQTGLPHTLDPVFHDACLRRGKEAIAGAVKKSQPVTHIAHGQAKVDRIASNRRIHRDARGQIIANRDSNGPTAELRALPAGLIDPWLKTVAFYNNENKVAACHYYATHPMSYYGDGRVSSDFAGLARRRRQLDEPDCLHVYFTGCAGNIAAGKYNDGSPARRVEFTQRLYDAIVQSEESLRKEPISHVEWRSTGVLPPPRETLVAADLKRQIEDVSGSVVNRCRSAFMLAWLHRLEKKIPLPVNAMHLNDITLLYLPAEMFIEYQFRAQQIDPDRFVAVAAYGDGGPWYIPTKEEYPTGGYETSVAFAGPEIDDLLTDAMTRLVK